MTEQTELNAANQEIIRLQTAHEEAKRQIGKLTRELAIANEALENMQYSFDTDKSVGYWKRDAEARLYPETTDKSGQ